MADYVDCRGLSGPEPVLVARQALQEMQGGTLRVLISNAVARDNVHAQQKPWDGKSLAREKPGF